MKKILMLLMAVSFVAFLTGCGGGGGSSTAVNNNDQQETVNETTNEEVFETQPEDSATNVTYLTTAQGDFPPAPPVASLKAAQDAANAELSN